MNKSMASKFRVASIIVLIVVPLDAAVSLAEPNLSAETALEQVNAIYHRMGDPRNVRAALDSIDRIVQNVKPITYDDFARLNLARLLWADCAKADGRDYQADSVYANIVASASVDTGPFPRKRSYLEGTVYCQACNRRVDRLLEKGRFLLAFQLEQTCVESGACTPRNSSVHEAAYRAYLACKTGDAALAQRILASRGRAIVDSLATSDDLLAILLSVKRHCPLPSLTALIVQLVGNAEGVRRTAWEDSILIDADTPAELANAIEERRRLAEDLTELREEEKGNEAVEAGFNKLSLQLGGSMAAVGVHFGDLQFMKEGGRDFSLNPRIRSLERQLVAIDRQIDRMINGLR